MGDIIQAVSRVGVNRKQDPRKFLPYSSYEFVILTGLDFQFDSLITACQLFFHSLHECLGGFANAERNATGNFVDCATQMLIERHAAELSFDIPQRIFNAAFGHFMATDMAHQSGELRCCGNTLADENRRKEVGQNMPSGVRGFRVIPRSLASRDLAPSAHAVGHNLDEHNSTVLHRAETCLERRLQTHADFAKQDPFDLHKLQVVAAHALIALQPYGRSSPPSPMFKSIPCIRICSAAPPEHIRWSPQKHDSQA